MGKVRLPVLKEFEHQACTLKFWLLLPIWQPDHGKMPRQYQGYCQKDQKSDFQGSTLKKQSKMVMKRPMGI